MKYAIVEMVQQNVSCKEWFPFLLETQLMMATARDVVNKDARAKNHRAFILHKP
jgi:predicted RNA binding protein with dsRBD fold (UPF0201 family)